MDITSLLVATVAGYAVGALWFAPFIFGKAWQRLRGVDMSKVTWRPMVFGFVIELVRAYVMAIVVAAMGAYSLITGIETGFWIWLGFVATVGLTQLNYEKMSFKLFAITYGYHLVAMVVMGAILATW